MEDILKSNNKKKNIRFNILSLITYVIGFILVFQLFSLQIINGSYYYNKTNSRLIRQTVIEAPRGEILDRNRK